MHYSDEDLASVADAADMPLARVQSFRLKLEAAALWYRLYRASPDRVAPSILERSLDRIRKAALKLLKVLGIEDPESAIDGPGDRAVFDALLSSSPGGEADILRACQNVGHLCAVLEAMEAAAVLARGAKQAAPDSREVGSTIVKPGHHGDEALNGWIENMLAIYGELSEREIGTSVGAQDRRDEGIAGGPLIRFLKAAAQPLEIELSSDAWRARVRLITSDPQSD